MNASVKFLRPGPESGTLVKTMKYALAFFLTLVLTASIIGIPLLFWAYREVKIQKEEEKKAIQAIKPEFALLNATALYLDKKSRATLLGTQKGETNLKKLLLQNPGSIQGGILITTTTYIDNLITDRLKDYISLDDHQRIVAQKEAEINRLKPLVPVPGSKPSASSPSLQSPPPSPPKPVSDQIQSPPPPPNRLPPTPKKQESMPASDLATENARLKSEVQKLQNNLRQSSAAAQSAAGAELKLATSERAKKQLEAEKFKLQEELKNAKVPPNKQELIKLRQEFAAVQEELTKATQSLTAAAEEAKKNQETVSTLQQQLNDANKKITELESQTIPISAEAPETVQPDDRTKEDTKGLLLTSQTECDALKAQNSALESEIKTVRAQLKAAESKKINAELRISENLAVYDFQRVELESQITQLKQQVESLKADLKKRPKSTMKSEIEL